MFYMTSNQDDAVNKFGLLLEKLLTLKRLPSSIFAEEAKYQSFIKHVVTAEFEKFQLFDKFQQRIDVFLGIFLSEESMVMFMMF